MTEILSQAPEATGIRSGTEFRIVMLGSLLYNAGAAIFYIMPAFLALIGGRLSLDPAQLGAIAGAESLAIAIASLTGPIWIARLDRRLCVIAALAVCALGNFATAFAGNFALVLISRFVIGLFGEGVLYTIGFMVLSAARNVDRSYAIALTASLVYGAAIMAASAALETLMPGIGLLVPLSVAALAILPCIAWLALVDRWEPVRGGIGSLFRGRSLLAVVALAGQAIWFGAPGAFWTFAEQVATDKGVSTGTAEIALSIGELAGLTGCVLAAWLGDRWGRLKPIAAATAGLIISAIIYQYSSEAAWLCLFLSIFYASWEYGCVYQMSFTNALDPSGRATVIMPAAQVFGLSVAPFITGWLMTKAGDTAVTTSTAAFAIAGLALFVICFARMRRQPTLVN